VLKQHAFTHKLGGADPLEWIGYKRVSLPISVFKKVLGGSPPEDGMIGVHPVLLFDKTSDESVYYEWHVPLDYIDGTDITFCVKWAPTDAGAGSVTWGIEYEIVRSNNGETLGTGTSTLIVVGSTNSLANELLCTGPTGMKIDGTGVKKGDFIGLRGFRDADASHGGAVDDYAADAALVSVCIRYKSNRFGMPS